MKRILFSKALLLMLTLGLAACRENKELVLVPDSYFRLSQVDGKGNITAYADSTYQDSNPAASYSRVEPVFYGLNKNGMILSTHADSLTIPFKAGQSYSVNGQNGRWAKDTTLTYWLDPRYLTIVNNVLYQVDYVKLLEFKAAKNPDGSYAVTFQTSREVNLCCYFLQASQDKKTWSNAVSIRALDNGKETNTYSYTYSGQTE